MVFLGLIVVGILIICYFIDRCPVELPQVHQFGRGRPHVVVVAGTHGNEPAPGHLLQLLVQVLKDEKFNPDYKLTIVPYVNYSAVETGTRSLWCQADVNRRWSSHPTKINAYLMPIVQTADVVLDMHEAWGTHTCSSGASLGQTIYTNNSVLDQMGRYVVDTLNSSFDYPDPCYRWTQRYKMSHIPGALDDWCTKMEIPYMLAEITGQNDIVDMETRMREAQVIITSFLNYLKLSFI